MWDLIQEYKEEMFGCTNNLGRSSHLHRIHHNLLTPCDQIPTEEMELRYRQDPHVSFVVKAVSAITAAFRLVQLEQCRGEEVVSCLNRLYDNGLHESILRNLRKLSFSSMMPRGQGQDEQTQHHFNRNGRLVANKQLIYSIDQDDGLQSVSN
jgi:hypothetical protein